LAFAHRQKPRAGGPLTQQALEDAALRYLNRFDCSASKLRRHLGALIRRHAGDATLETHVDSLIVRYQASGLLDDQRFGKNLAERFQARGASKRMVVQKLRARGISRDVADEVVRSSRDSDLESARAYVRRRRLGPNRPEAERAANRRKDLAALARQGFDHDTAVRALGHGTDEDF
jgi:regulatory protein